eukprot:408233-Pyramimonas_sp.AAC.1
MFESEAGGSIRSPRRSARSLRGWILQTRVALRCICTIRTCAVVTAHALALRDVLLRTCSSAAVV